MFLISPLSLSQVLRALHEHFEAQGDSAAWTLVQGTVICTTVAVKRDQPLGQAVLKQ